MPEKLFLLTSIGQKLVISPFQYEISDVPAGCVWLVLYDLTKCVIWSKVLVTSLQMHPMLLDVQLSIYLKFLVRNIVYSVLAVLTM